MNRFTPRSKSKPHHKQKKLKIWGFIIVAVALLTWFISTQHAPATFVKSHAQKILIGIIPKIVIPHLSESEKQEALQTAARHHDVKTFFLLLRARSDLEGALKAAVQQGDTTAFTWLAGCMAQKNRPISRMNCCL